MYNEERLRKSFYLLRKDIEGLKFRINEFKEEPKKGEIVIDREYEKFFENKVILITGGLGFIGSNIAHRLTKLKHKPKKIILLDSMIQGLGGNKFNVYEIEDKVQILVGKEWDLRNIKKMSSLLKHVDIVFNLAGSVSHIGSKENPLFDLELNLLSHLKFLEACKKVKLSNPNKKLKIVYAGTRDQYGKVKQEALPVKESHLISEVADPQGINKSAAEFYHFWYRHFGIETCSLRLSNIYGPRHIMTDAGQGVLNWFIRQVIDDETMKLWGGGEPLRDFIYVDDVVEAFLMVAASDNTDGKLYNLGAYRKKNGMYEHLCDSVKSIKKTAELLIKIVGQGKVEIIPYPEDRKSLEPGHFYADATKIFEEVGWEPKVDLDEGLKRSISFYKKYKKHYWNSKDERRKN